ncbi:MAG: SH3 domain-containing protein [Collimonas sp.]|uniref:SH3 domain-containing protein n=1 Tax=Collimonas sp. TaxID=1963772 RepID=UPI003266EEAB
MIRIRLIPLLAACLIFPVAAMAQQAFTSKPVNLRAGPARDYPLVAQLAPGTPVSVAGCINGYSWCDVTLQDGNRGWVYAQNLSYPYQGNQVPLITYGGAIGLPIIAFSLGTYWGQYYRGRPWYGQQSHWAHRPRPPTVRPPPRPHPRPPAILPGKPHPPGLGGGQRPPPSGIRPPGGRPPGGGRPPNGGNRPQPR